MLDDNTAALAAAAAQESAPQNVIVGAELTKIDSVRTVLHDTLTNMGGKDIVAALKGENTILRDALSSLVDLSARFVPKLIGAILILWVGLKLIKLLKRGLTRLLTKREAEASLSSFLTSLVDVLMKVLLVIMAMDIIGIKATSFIAIIGAMGLAVGMALQGTLQNFAGGVIILLMRPFRVGDYIECGIYKGYVKEIRIFHTIIRPFNGRTIIVPNSELATKSLINHTHEPIIRLDIVASVAYGTDLDYAKNILKEVVNAEPLINRELKEPTIAVSDLANSSVDISLWLWVKTEDYWTVWLRIRENIYKAFATAGIEIPFPQVQIHTDAPVQQQASTTEPRIVASLRPNLPPLAQEE